MSTGSTALIFGIQTMQVMNGRALRSMEPDADGWYRGIPLGVIGAPSRNKAVYDPPSVVQCMTNPATPFYKKLVEGNLRGEYGHPLVKTQADIMRVIHIDMARVSHAIGAVETKKTDNDKFVIIFGDVKPTGPYGKDLEASLQDGTMNTSFSLRSLCTKPREVGGYQYKRMLSMVTFDAVDGPGYEEASKRYASQECQIPLKEVMESDAIMDTLGLESNDCDQLFDLLKTDSVKVKGIDENLIFDTANGRFITPGGQKSIFDTMFNGGK